MILLPPLLGDTAAAAGDDDDDDDDDGAIVVGTVMTGRTLAPAPAPAPPPVEPPPLLRGGDLALLGGDFDLDTGLFAEYVLRTNGIDSIIWVVTPDKIRQEKVRDKA